MDNQEKPKVLVPALIFGAVIGLAMIVLTLVFYFLDLSFKTWAGILIMVVLIALVVYALVAYKKEQGKGFASFGRLVLMSFLFALISMVIFIPFNLALYSFDKEFFEQTKYESEIRVNKMMDRQLMRNEDNPNFGAIESRVESQRSKAIDRLDAASPFDMARQGLGMFLFIGVLTGLIAGAIIKKDPDPLANQAV